VKDSGAARFALKHRSHRAGIRRLGFPTAELAPHEIGASSMGTRLRTPASKYRDNKKELAMKNVLHWLLGVLMCLAVTGAGLAQYSGGPAQTSTGSQRMQERISREVFHELVMLPQLSIFDNLQYKVDGSKVKLKGQVRNAVLKDSAEKTVKSIEGVESVDNQIEVLPPSPIDDKIRIQVARAIFNDDRLFRYSMGSVPPVHIIVKGGHVTLEGVVDSQTDKDQASLRANGVPGVFSVENHLQVQKS
jgi:hyperosmotically inducible protein